MIELERRLYIKNFTAGLLLNQNNLSSVIDVRDMQLPKNIYISTFQNYSEITGVSVNDLSHNGFYDDGYTIKAGKSSIILYNSLYDIICPQRLRFSLAHEVGHIFLNHIVDDAKSEEEANYFASQIVAHDALVVTMLKDSWDATVCYIRDQFGISWDTAAIKLRYLNRNKRSYNQTEVKLFQKYKNSFNTKRYNRNKFADASTLLWVECDEV